MPGRSSRPCAAWRRMSGFAFGLRLRASHYAGTRRRGLACPGVVLDQVLASKGMPGFATLRRGRLRSRPLVENEARWAARGLEPADGSDLWFKAHPKEEPMNHSLAAVRHRARRARVTRDHRITSPVNSLSATIYTNNPQHSTTMKTAQWRGLPRRYID